MSCRLASTGLLVVLTTWGCARTPSASPAAGAAPDARKVVARVAGNAITMEEVDLRAAGKLSRLRDDEYQARRQALDEMIVERLIEKEAAARGISTEALLHTEVETKVTGPTPEEVKALYEQNKANAGGRTLEQVAPLIERSMRQQQIAVRAAAFRDELKAKAGVEISLEAPRTALAVPADAPTLGPAGAPVTIVEFLDYQCPFCHRVQGAVDEVLQRYPGQVRFVHREYLLGKPRSRAAARAARCAGEQGKFWEYHRDLLEKPGDMGDEDLQRRASGMGLNPGNFAACVASDRFDAVINSSTESAGALGIDSTPTFFVNGRRLVGVQTGDQFREVIDAELKKS
jgi:protein-disulfide isomerase